MQSYPTYAYRLVSPLISCTSPAGSLRKDIRVACPLQSRCMASHLSWHAQTWLTPPDAHRTLGSCMQWGHAILHREHAQRCSGGRDLHGGASRFWGLLQSRLRGVPARRLPDPDQALQGLQGAPCATGSQADGFRPLHPAAGYSIWSGFYCSLNEDAYASCALSYEDAAVCMTSDRNCIRSFQHVK